MLTIMVFFDVLWYYFQSTLFEQECLISVPDFTFKLFPKEQQVQFISPDKFFFHFFTNLKNLFFFFPCSFLDSHLLTHYLDECPYFPNRNFQRLFHLFICLPPIQFVFLFYHLTSRRFDHFLSPTDCLLFIFYQLELCFICLFLFNLFLPYWTSMHCQVLILPIVDDACLQVRAYHACKHLLL